MTFELFRGWAFLAAVLFFGSLVHEDAAIFAGGYLVAEKHLPAVLAALSLYMGVVLGDFAIYGLGRVASRSEKLAQLLARFGGAMGGRRLDNASGWLSERLFWIVCGCRLTPTMLFPTFAAIGWTGIPFRRFAAAVLVSATLYVPPVFFAVLLFGNALVNRLQAWGWPLMAVGAVAVWLIRRRTGPLASKPEAPAQGELRVHSGMPALRAEDVRVPLSERINPIVFYAPLLFQWLWLGLRYRSQTLPTLANPSIEAGGLLGESKYACMELVAPSARRWLAKSVSVETDGGPEGVFKTHRQVLAAMDEAELTYPVVVKPDIGWRGIGVRRLDSEEDLRTYLRSFPLGNRLLVQEYVSYDGEAGVFYVRDPGSPAGRIFSMTFRYHPFIIGDGRSSFRELILANERTRWKADLHLAAHAAQLDRVPEAGEVIRLATVASSRVGGLYIDAREWVTPEMTARFDEIAKSIPEFWFGRFDVRFDTIERLQAGEGFIIVEVNGAGAEAIHMWDPNFPLLEAYKTLFRQQALMFAIADANRRRGFTPLTVRQLVACQQRQQRLLKMYPESN